MEPTLMMRAGSDGVPAFSSSGSISRVRKKTDLTLVSITLSHPDSGYSAAGAIHTAPALFTRIFKRDSCAATSVASAAQPAAVETSAGTEMHSPALLNSFATSSHTDFLRDEMYTFAPPSRNPRAIIKPIPREP